MAHNRSEKMGNRQGLAGFIDRLRYHELSRQGLGLILVMVCAWFAVPGEKKVSSPPWSAVQQIRSITIFESPRKMEILFPESK